MHTVELAGKGPSSSAQPPPLNRHRPDIQLRSLTHSSTNSFHMSLWTRLTPPRLHFTPFIMTTSALSPISPLPSHSSDLEGHIQVIFGPMFSGKTTELMRRIRRYTHAKKRCQVIKYKKDTRYDDECASTHDLQKCEARGCNVLSELSDASLMDLDVIGIDEGQFFTDIVAFADKWASLGKVVIIGALDATFERKPFGRILNLIPVAEQVLKLNAVCMLCHRDASFTKRIGKETAVEVIGGADKYLSTCRACFATPADSPMNAAGSASPQMLVSPSPVFQVSSPVMLTKELPAAFVLPAVAIAPAPALNSKVMNNKRITPSVLKAIDSNLPLVDASMGVSRKRKVALESEQEEKRQFCDKENAAPEVC